ncbi:MAG: DUF2190 family protein [Gemmatimonadaceae bacterium]|nr:DUF2190 family protein [Gemmatimonadaceae bacterium]
MNNQNYVQPGRILTLAAPYDRLTSGLGAMIGSLFGVSMDTVLSGADGQFETEGVHNLLKTSAQAWTAGDKVYWNAGTKLCDNDPTTGRHIGTAVEAAANPTASGKVKLLGNSSPLAEGVQAAVVVLTDSTGLSGTHDDTLAATAALVTLTDSTGDSGTHDDTLADGLSSTAPDAVTTSALGDLVATNGGWGSSSEAGFDSISTKFDAAVADITAMRATLLAVQADAAVQNQNDSDLAQKVIEVVAQLAVTNQNISDVAQKVLEIRTVLVTAGLITP